MKKIHISFLPLLLLATPLLLASVNCSLIVECGECRDKYTLYECIKLMGEEVDRYEEHPLSPGEQCSSLDLNGLFLVFRCGQKEPEQCKMKKQLIGEVFAWTQEQTNMKFPNLLPKYSKERNNLKIPNWCACSLKKQKENLNLNKISDEQIWDVRYLEQVKQTKENKNKINDLLNLKSHETLEEEACPLWCEILVVIASFAICLSIIAGIYSCCCKRNEEQNVVVNPAPFQPQPPIEQYNMGIAYPPFQEPLIQPIYQFNPNPYPPPPGIYNQEVAPYPAPPLQQPPIEQSRYHYNNGQPPTNPLYLSEMEEHQPASERQFQNNSHPL